MSGAPSVAAPAPVAIDGMKLLVGGAIVTVLIVAIGGLIVRRGMPPAPAMSVSAAAPVDRETAVRAAIQKVPITMYTTSWCPVCKRAKAWMRSNAIPFQERDVEADPEAAKARAALTSSRGVPTIDVDGEVFVGFDQAGLTRAVHDAAARRL